MLSLFRPGAVLLVSALIVVSSCAREKATGTEILFWQFWEEPALYQSVREFEQKNPGVKVRIETLTWQSGLEKILASVASGHPPDLCELGSTWVARFAAGEKLVPLGPEGERWVRDNFYLPEAAIWNGRLYGIPWLIGTRALFYNKELFERAGLNPELPPATWQDLLEAAKRVDSLGGGIRGYGVNSGEREILFKKFMPFAWSNGGDILSADLKRSVLSSRENVEALKYYIELSRYSLLEKQDILDRFFLTGKLGMNLSGGWNLRRIELEAPELRYGVTTFPTPARGRGVSASFGGAEFLAVFSASPRKAEAVALAKFLAEGAQAFELCREVRSVLPAMKEFDSGDYFDRRPMDKVFTEQLRTSMSTPSHPAWPEMEDILNTYLELALRGRLDPETALSEASVRIQAIVDRESSVPQE